jgi:hypothetical protein
LDKLVEKSIQGLKESKKSSVIYEEKRPLKEVLRDLDVNIKELEKKKEMREND